jgi:hypothetical protein
MAKRSSSQRIGQKASLAAIELLIEGGCAVNTLEQDDVGFDLHAILPAAFPAASDRSWSMSSSSILVQVKGGDAVMNAVKLDKERWTQYLAQKEPVYIAAVPPDGERWIASVYELFPNGVHYFPAGIVPGYPPDPHWKPKTRWEPETLVKDALINAGIPTPADRLWWQVRLPKIVEDDETQALDILNSLVDLSLLHAAATANGAPVDLSEAQDFAAEIVNASPETNELLTTQGMFDGERVEDVDWDSTARLTAHGTLEPSSMEDVSRLATLELSQPASTTWGLVELRLLTR